jgi:hypothetical protein
LPYFSSRKPLVFSVGYIPSYPEKEFFINLLKSSTMATVTWAATPAQEIVPAVFAPAQGPYRSVSEKSRALIIEVAAGEYERQNSPVFFLLPESWRDEQRFTLKRRDR